MTTPTNKEINDVLDKLEPRWQSNAEKENLPRSNQHDRGGKLLRTDEVLRKSEPDYVKEK